MNAFSHKTIALFSQQFRISNYLLNRPHPFRIFSQARKMRSSLYDYQHDYAVAKEVSDLNYVRQEVACLLSARGVRANKMDRVET
jgi:hypothetical protein